MQLDEQKVLFVNVDAYDIPVNNFPVMSGQFSVLLG